MGRIRMFLENLQRASAQCRRDAAILRTALCVAALLLPATAAAKAASSPPGPLLGQFALEPIPLPALKRSAADRPVPATGAVQAMARVGAGFQPASLAPYGWRLVSGSLGFATLEGDPAMLPLLRALAERPSAVHTRHELRRTVFADTEAASIVDTYVYYLRRKLGRDAVATVHGTGYRLGSL